MKLLKFVAAIVLCTAASFAIGKGQACSTEQAIQADAALATLHVWSDAINYYKRHQICLDGGVNEGYNQFLAELLSADQGVEFFWAETRQQTWFRLVVARRMESEAISLETTESILKNLRAQCPFTAKQFCRNLTQRIRAVCSACTTEP